MANCSKHFKVFSKKISVNPTRIKRLTGSRRMVEKSLRLFVKNNIDLGVPMFKLQGSYKDKTTVLDWHADHDIDLGVYFKSIPEVKPVTLMKYVYDLGRDLTWYGAEFKMKCVQIYFRNEYSIDLPIYCFDQKNNGWVLATKSGWKRTDPQGFSSWLTSKKDSSGQLIRIVKYFKMWANEQNFKTPKGIALTVWAAKYHVQQAREDIAFISTLKKLRFAVKKKMICKMPVVPYDNLVVDLDKKQLAKFIAGLEKLIQVGEDAVNHPSLLQSSRLWRTELGDYFPIRMKV